MKSKVYITKAWMDCPIWWRQMILHIRKENNIEEDNNLPPELIIAELAKHNATEERLVDWKDPTKNKNKMLLSRLITFETESDYIACVLKWS